MLFSIVHLLSQSLPFVFCFFFCCWVGSLLTTTMWNCTIYGNSPIHITHQSNHRKDDKVGYWSVKSCFFSPNLQFFIMNSDSRLSCYFLQFYFGLIGLLFWLLWFIDAETDSSDELSHVRSKIHPNHSNLTVISLCRFTLGFSSSALISLKCLWLICILSRLKFIDLAT